jgi:DNA primase
MNCDDLNEMDLVSYLASMGIQPVRVVGDFYYYLSPIRQENTPSFRIERSKKKWTDFGLELKRKSFVDFIMAYHHIDVREVLRRFNTKEIKSPPFVQRSDLQLDKMPEPLRVKVNQEAIIHSPALLHYLKKRKIDLKIADQYCREVNFTVNDKTYYGIGFRNDSGGFDIRNPYMKAAESKDITTIDNGATVVRVFEGFFDFLTFMTLHQDNPPRSNYLILNSAHLMHRKSAYDFMEGHEKVLLFLDNDPTGDRYTHEALEADGKRYEDHRFHYKSHGDLNEWSVDQPETAQSRKKVLMTR